MLALLLQSDVCNYNESHDYTNDCSIYREHTVCLASASCTISFHQHNSLQRKHFHVHNLQLTKLIVKARAMSTASSPLCYNLRCPREKVRAWEEK